MKNLFAFTTVLLLLSSSCKKDNSSNNNQNNNNNNNNTTSPYYFKGTFNNTSYDLNADFPQYIAFYTNEIGGYQVANAGLYPSIGIRLTWPDNDTVKESDVMGLIGKTLHFSDTSISPELSFDASSAIDSWYSADTANTNYNIKITNVVYLGNDITLGYHVRTYVITGTCNATMYNDSNDSTAAFSGGDFNFIISRRDL